MVGTRHSCNTLRLKVEANNKGRNLRQPIPKPHETLKCVFKDLQDFECSPEKLSCSKIVRE